MSTPDFGRVKEVLLQVMELPAAGRAPALDRLCGADAALRAEVESLLAHDGPLTADLLPTHPASLAPAAGGRAATPVGPGEAIGPYRLGALIGEGGMGVVYRATQEAPLRRDVALKLIKPGMDSAGVLARFAAERQALALMDHPSIARVIDAGTADSGRPYFVMELVAGEPLSTFSWSEGLTVRERLELFLLVCQAVQHAHQKGMIHRDLKPSNILVARQDGKPVPKVIDFGIAKAVADPLGTGPLLTREGLPIGTPEYMSPEQAGIVPGGVDTRSDVYSLGVILYELLVGRLPLIFDSSSPEEVRRVLTNQAPTRPSLAVRTDGAGRESSAAPRGGTPRGRRRLSRELTGDLDNVVMKALHRERERRYASVEQLAEDVRRHLDSRPVRARPDSLAYRASRFARRHRAGVAVGAAAAVLLALAGAGLVVQSWRVARERDRALVAEERARAQAARATAEADTAREVSEFLVELFEVSDPANSRGESVTAVELVERGATRIEKELEGQPEVQGRLLGTVGQVHHALGRYEEAEALTARALDLQREALGPEHREVARSLNMLGTILHDLGDYEGSERRYREALDLRRRLGGEESPELAESLNHLAVTLQARGDPAGAEPLYREALDLNRRLLGPDHQETAWSLNSLAWSIHAQGRLREAEPLYREALAQQRRHLGDVHPDVAHTLNNLGGVRFNLGDYADAETIWREALGVYRSLYGEHAAVARGMHHLGNVLRLRGRLEEAEPLARDALDMNRRLLGDDHPHAATTQWGVAMVHLERGRLREAERLLVEAIGAYEEALDGSHRLVVAARGSLARCLLRQGRADEAESLARRLLEQQRAAPGPSTVRLAGSLHLLGEVLLTQRRPASAEPALREALSVYRSLLPEGHPDTGRVLISLGQVRMASGDAREAVALLDEGLLSRRRVLPPDHSELARIAALLKEARGRAAG